MRNVIRSAAFTAAIFALSGGFIACSKKADTSARLNDEASVLNPTPLDRTSIDSQLKRYSTQTSFLNYSHSRFPGDIRPLAATERSATATKGGRAIQESDVFKVIEGQNTLLLLNNARGIQTVSFKDGLTKPVLVGRSGATGNYSDDMYYDAASKQVYVLERYWYDENEPNNWDVRNSRILTYALDKANKPTLKETVEVKGEIAQHRMVGDVLYVATTEWNNFGNGEARGNVFAFKSQNGKLKQVGDGVRLSLPVSGRENLNIVETDNGAGKEPGYYLVAVLSKSPWGWGDRQNTIEVLDISDKGGVIKPVMLVNAKGVVNEKTNTFIKNNTLVVVSNYLPNVPNAKMRVAVETFRFPSAEDEKVDADEGLLRTQTLKVALNHIADPEERDAKYNTLVEQLKLKKTVIETEVEDPNTGVKTLKSVRPVANSLVSVGDTRGQNAGLMDVRVLKNRLLVFWVPVNNIDPLDIFDLTSPEKGVKHLATNDRIAGWVERSFPLEYKGRQFIVGLGWQIPSVNNETNRRYPQAVLFEITEKNGKVDVEVVGKEFVIDANKNVWADLNSSDKLVEFRLSKDGKRGTIMYPVSSWAANSFGSGGQLVELDLDAAAAGKDAFFKQGGVIAGNAGWLKRVFTNPELGAIQTFSDLALGTYAPKGIGEAGKVERAVSVLELARNIEGYVALGKVGVQIISNSESYDGTAAASSSLRLVDLATPDAELNSIKGELRLKGPATSHLALKDKGEVLVLGVESKWEKIAGAGTNDPQYKYFTEYNLSRVGAKEGKLALNGTTSWVSERQRRPFPVFFESRRMFPGIWWGGYGSASLGKTKEGVVYVNTGTEILLVDVASSGVVVRSLDTKSCQVKDRTLALEVVGGNLVATSTEFVNDPARKNLTFSRNFVAKAKIQGAKLECEAAVNIPGRAIAFTADGGIVTEDSQLDHLEEVVVEGRNGREKEVYYEPTMSNVLMSLVSAKEGTKSVAKLVAEYPRAMNGRALNAIGKPGAERFVFVEQHEDNRWAPSVVNFVELEKGEFRETLDVIKVKDASDREVQNFTLVKVVADPKGEYLGLAVSGRRAVVLRLDSTKRELKVVKVQSVNPDGTRAAASELFTIQDAWSLMYGQNDDAVHFTESQRSFEISLGLSGVSQVYLAE